jgi:hypothetical protein
MHAAYNIPGNHVGQRMSDKKEEPLMQPLGMDTIVLDMLLMVK